MAAEGLATDLAVGQVACFIGFFLSGLLWAYSELVSSKPSRKHEPEESMPLNITSKGDVESKEVEMSTRWEGSERGDKVTVISSSWKDAPLFKCLRLHSETLVEERGTLRAMAEFSLIMIWFFVADRTSMLPEAEKHYSRDLFLFLCLVLFIVALATSLHKGKAPTYLNRDQTEEWKGYMQVAFLLYHYFEAREAYNYIRLFIAAYVWMTGFGNFSYYYVRKDFTMGRFCQMMWRLNFLVFFTCMMLKNDYVLYYICPMHTIFTVFIYVVLGVGSQHNTNSTILAAKFAFCFVLVLVMWDIKSVFYTVFKPLEFLVGYLDPRNPKGDPLHEWYFRSGLDRYVWIYGMLCANFHPRMEAMLHSIDNLNVSTRWLVRSMIVGAVATVSSVYYQKVLSLDKLEYNKVHPYTSWIPITLFVIMRNLTPMLRSWHLALFAWLGKITLETYIAQFHVWLSSSVPNGQPKLLLSLIPEYPLLNFTLTTALYVLASKRLFDLTVTLRDSFIPGKDQRRLVRNMALMTVSWFALVAVALTVKLSMGGAPTARS